MPFLELLSLSFIFLILIYILHSVRQCLHFICFAQNVGPFIYVFSLQLIFTLCVCVCYLIVCAISTSSNCSIVNPIIAPWWWWWFGGDVMVLMMLLLSAKKTIIIDGDRWQCHTHTHINMHVCNGMSSTSKWMQVLIGMKWTIALSVTLNHHIYFLLFCFVFWLFNCIHPPPDSNCIRSSFLIMDTRMATRTISYLH